VPILVNKNKGKNNNPHLNHNPRQMRKKINKIIIQIHKKSKDNIMYQNMTQIKFHKLMKNNNNMLLKKIIWDMKDKNNIILLRNNIMTQNNILAKI
jgi:predicted Zn-dependent protease with MMP-like domain